MTTGHSEIDRQHFHLHEILERLDKVCANPQDSQHPCAWCSGEKAKGCSDRLATLLGELLGFMLEHFMYEEKLMKLLPATDASHHHILAHKKAHADISQLISALAEDMDNENPKASALHLRQIAHAWLGDHQNTDYELAIKLEGAYKVEVEYDKELSAMLHR